jgi:hypothetical protein
MSALRMDVTTRLAIWQELLKQEMTGLHLPKITENFSAIKIKEMMQTAKSML